jgi:trk system potassium uptake protein TrkA
MMQKDRYVAFVCTGNTCRSPMAERIFNKKAEEQGVGVRAVSFGMAAVNGMPPSPDAVKVCKEIGVETVIAKCANEMHKAILSKVGADKVVFPEKESGVRLAKNLLSANFIDVIELSKDVSVIEFEVKPDWVGKTLVDLNLRKKYAVNVIAIRQRNDLNINVDPTMPLTNDMQLVVITNTSKLTKLK